MHAVLGTHSNVSFKSGRRSSPPEKSPRVVRNSAARGEPLLSLWSCVCRSSTIAMHGKIECHSFAHSPVPSGLPFSLSMAVFKAV